MNKLNQTIVFLILFLPFLSNAQGWEKTYGGDYDENVYSADQTLDGGIIMAGTQSDNPNNVEYSFLYKTDVDGNLQWAFYDSVHVGTFVNTLKVKSTSDGNFLLSSIYGNNPPNNDVVVQKITPSGTVLWENSLTTPYLDYVNQIEETSDGGYILAGTYSNPQITTGVGVVRIENSGSVVWEKGFEVTDIPLQVAGLTIAANNDILLSGYQGYVGTQDAFIKRLDENNGSVIWEKEFDKALNDFGLDILELDNGEIVLSGFTTDAITGPITNHSSLLKVDANGNEIWYKEYTSLGEQNLRGFKKTLDGGFVLSGSYNPANTSFPEIFMLKVDGAGNELWTKSFGRNKTDWSADVFLSSNGGFYIAGYTQNQDDSYDAYLIKTDSLGNSFTNEISGNIYHDENLNCAFDPTETGLSQWMIEVQKDDINYMSLTDSLGNYSFNLDTGTYEMNVFPVSPYWALCDSTFSFSFSNFNDTITQNVFAQTIISCPLLDVSIGTPFLRRCFENTYTVQYCNYGTTTAEDAYVEVDFDPAMIILNSSIPITSQTGNFLTFDIGDVQVGDCGSFTVDILLGDSTNCDSISLGATHCVAAHIYPDSICLPSGNWSGASVEVDALCAGDSITFIIRNVGTAPTQSNLNYIVVEDNVVLVNGNFTLVPNESETITIPTNGSTFRLEAEQEPDHPGMSMPSISVENCGTANTLFTLGFVNIFAPDDGDPFIDIDCRQNIGAYDPNDKQGFPLGYGAENYINIGQDIEYLIRFQNTGTDTAFNVVIKDELSELLDITTLRPGASSHPYDFSISENRTLNFTFNNIMLPDSNVNELASNGFVKFKVAQIPDLDLETKIHNSAAIYFDFNVPIITNQTLHTIGEDRLISVSIDEPKGSEFAKVKIFPNPFSDFVNIEVKDLEIKNGAFKLYDARGRMLRVQQFNNNTFTFYKKDLQTGMYFFTIENNGLLISSGKLIAQ